MDNITRESLDTLAQCIKDLVCMTPANEQEFLQEKLSGLFNTADKVQDRVRMAL